MENSAFKAVIFDLDGTLIDTITDIADAVNWTLKASGFDAHPLDAYHSFIGNGWRHLIYKALPEGTSRKTVQAVYDKSKKHYQDNLDKTTAPYRGIPVLLDFLAEQRIATAVLTNKSHELAVQCIQKILPDRSFDCIMGRSEHFKPKPDPEGAFIISEKFRVPAGQFLFIGDSDVDMITARAAGMFGIGACWGYRSKAELMESGSKALAHEPEEVIRRLS